MCPKSAIGAVTGRLPAWIAQQMAGSKVPEIEPTRLAGASPLAGLRVLIVEDEAAIGLIMEEMLGDLGCAIVGPAADLAAGLELAEATAIDLAVLDVNLAGREAYPIADLLRQRNIPVVFSTGYGDQGVKSGYQDAPVVQKPFRLSELKRCLEAISLGRPPAGLE